MKMRFMKFSILMVFLLIGVVGISNRLTLVTNPPQSLVYVNGVLVGQTNDFGNISVNVENGSEIKIENIGYFPKVFVYNSSASSTITVSLKPISYLSISAVPQDSDALIDGSEFSLPATVTLPAGKHLIIVKRNGYVSQRVMVVTKPFALLRKKFNLERSGKILVTTTPSHVNLSMDGGEFSVTPFSTYLQPGKHTITVSASGYSSLSTAITIPKESEPISIHLTLKKLLKVTIDSSPTNAVVTMNSTVFITPATLELNAGKYTYVASQTYSYPATGTLIIKNSGKYVINLKPKIGLVVFTSNPMGAAINLNGKFIGQTQKSVQLPYGNYKVRMVGSNGKVWFGTFIMDQEIKTIYGDMVNSGMVVINAYPSTGTIAHIGQVWTSVPATLNAAVGVYRVEFFNPAFPTLSRYVEVEAGRVSKIDVSLQPMSTFFVMTKPLGAEVELDGRIIGKAPLFDVKTKAGEHLLSVKWNDGKMEKKLIMNKDQVYSFNFTDPNSVKVKFVSYPDPLKLIVDDKEKGYTPLSVQLTRGIHTYKIFDVLDEETASGTLDTTYFSSETYFFLNGR